MKVIEIKPRTFQVNFETREELLKMSKVSHELGMSYTPEIWSDRLLKILE